MKKTNNFLFLFAAFAALLLSACKGGGSYDLKFNPAAGSKYKYTVTMNQKLQQTVQGQTKDMDNATEIYATYEVQAGSGTDKVLKLTYDRFKGTASGMTFDTDVADSAGTSGNPMSAIFSSMKGQSISMTVSAKGEVKEVKGVEELLDKMVANMPGDSATKPMMKENIKKLMGEDYMKSMMEQSFKIYPAGAVKIGDNWKTDMEMKNGIALKLANTFTLKSVENNVAKLDVKSDISSGSMEMMGMKIETDLKGTQTGTFDLDVPTGMATSGDITQEISGNMKVMGMEMPMKIQTKMKISCVKI
ncbi:MAG: hypothetical protein J0I41_01760 [Filimonas sp.]|nr:hypothetical protein [Filimonas sp.]